MVIAITTERDPWNGLGDGLKVHVRLLVQVQENTIMVPVSALFPIGPRSGIFVLEGERRRLQEVTMKARNGVKAWLSVGLTPNGRVVVYPDIKLQNGAKVRARPTD